MLFNEFVGLLLCFLSYVNAEWNTKDFMKREHSLIKPYYGSGIEIPFWQFSGSTIVTPNYIRLTSDLQSKVGAIWNSVPVNVRNWELQVHFKVHGKGKDLFGDGFVIWYAKDRMREGPVFGNNDFFQGLAIILDTYSNHNGPHNVSTRPDRDASNRNSSTNTRTSRRWSTTGLCTTTTTGTARTRSWPGARPNSETWITIRTSPSDTKKTYSQVGSLALCKTPITPQLQFPPILKTKRRGRSASKSRG
jgi:hypothetical protein